MQIKTDKKKRTDIRKPVKKRVPQNFTEEILKEFPNDTALQEIHIARKILMQKASSKKMKYLDFVKSLSERS